MEIPWWNASGGLQKKKFAHVIHRWRREYRTQERKSTSKQMENIYGDAGRRRSHNTRQQWLSLEYETQHSTKTNQNQLNPEKKHFFVHRPFLQSLQCFLLDFQVMNSKYNNGGMLKSVISCPCQTNWISIWHTAQHPAIWQTYLERYKAVSNSRRQDIHWMKNMFCWAGKERGGHDSKLCWLNFYIKLSWQQKLPEEK